MKTLLNGLIVGVIGLAIAGIITDALGLVTLSGWQSAALVVLVLLCACWLSGRR